MAPRLQPPGLREVRAQSLEGWVVPGSAPGHGGGPGSAEGSRGIRGGGGRGAPGPHTPGVLCSALAVERRGLSLNAPHGSPPRRPARGRRGGDAPLPGESGPPRTSDHPGARCCCRRRRGGGKGSRFQGPLPPRGERCACRSPRSCPRGPRSLRTLLPLVLRGETCTGSRTGSRTGEVSARRHVNSTHFPSQTAFLFFFF